MSSNTPGPTDAESMHQVYAEQLRRHAVDLIWLGYGRLNSKSLTLAGEDDITGELVREMKSVAQDPLSPDWVDRYEVHEQVQQNVHGKRGKHRPRMDIEIECHRRGPRPRLGFEAKRLGRGTSGGGYLGQEGLGAFLDGHYPTTHGDAGMLGYIQDQTRAHWSKQITNGLSSGLAKFRIITNENWETILNSAPCCCTSHNGADGKPLCVIHILLAFT